MTDITMGSTGNPQVDAAIIGAQVAQKLGLFGGDPNDSFIQSGFEVGKTYGTNRGRPIQLASGLWITPRNNNSGNDRTWVNAANALDQMMMQIVGKSHNFAGKNYLFDKNTILPGDTSGTRQGNNQNFFGVSGMENNLDPNQGHNFMNSFLGEWIKAARQNGINDVPLFDRMASNPLGFFTGEDPFWREQGLNHVTDRDYVLNNAGNSDFWGMINSGTTTAKQLKDQGRFLPGTSWNPETKTATRSDGTTIEHGPQGQRIETSKDGTQTVYRPDGTILGDPTSGGLPSGSSQEDMDLWEWVINQNPIPGSAGDTEGTGSQTSTDNRQTGAPGTTRDAPPPGVHPSIWERVWDVLGEVGGVITSQGNVVMGRTGRVLGDIYGVLGNVIFGDGVGIRDEVETIFTQGGLPDNVGKILVNGEWVDYSDASGSGNQNRNTNTNVNTNNPNIQIDIGGYGGAGASPSADARIGDVTTTSQGGNAQNTNIFADMFRGMFGDIFGGGSGVTGDLGILTPLIQALTGYFTQQQSADIAGDYKDIAKQFQDWADPYFPFRQGDATQLQGMFSDPFKSTPFDFLGNQSYERFGSGVPHLTDQPFTGYDQSKLANFPELSLDRFSADNFVAGEGGRLDLGLFDSQNQSANFNYGQFRDPSRFQYPEFNFQFDESDPSYQWRFNEGKRATERAFAAQGGRGSGNVLADLMKYGQGMASQEYQAEFGRDFNSWMQNRDLAYNTSRENWARGVQEWGLGLDLEKTRAGFQSDDFLRDLQKYQTNIGTQLTQNQTNYQRNFNEWLANTDLAKYADATNADRNLAEWQSNFNLAQTQLSNMFGIHQWNTEQGRQANTTNYGRDLQNYLTNFQTQNTVDQQNYMRRLQNWMGTTEAGRADFNTILDALLKSSGAGRNAEGLGDLTTLLQGASDMKNKGDLTQIFGLLSGIMSLFR